MFKNLDLDNDATIKAFQSFKNFTFTNNDSGSGVFATKARSGSKFNYVSSSDAITTITSGSVSTNYFGLPTYTMLHNLFYSKHGKEYVNTGSMNRNLHDSASVISVARELYGEKIKPGSIELSATVGGQTFDIRDDGEGNLVLSGSAEYYTKPERVVGDVIYTHGQVIITDRDIANYYSTYLKPVVEWKANQPIYTYNVHCKVKDSEMNFTYNRTAVSGSDGVLASNITGSEFTPYITTVGLYNDASELIALAKLGKPIPKSQNSDMTFEIKIDI